MNFKKEISLSSTRIRNVANMWVTTLPYSRTFNPTYYMIVSRYLIYSNAGMIQMIRGVKVQQPGGKLEAKKPARRNIRSLSSLAGNSSSLAPIRQTVRWNWNMKENWWSLGMTCDVWYYWLQLTSSWLGIIIMFLEPKLCYV